MNVLIQGSISFLVGVTTLLFSYAASSEVRVLLEPQENGNPALVAKGAYEKHKGCDKTIEGLGDKYEKIMISENYNGIQTLLKPGANITVKILGKEGEEINSASEYIESLRSGRDGADVHYSYIKLGGECNSQEAYTFKQVEYASFSLKNGKVVSYLFESEIKMQIDDSSDLINDMVTITKSVRVK